MTALRLILDPVQFFASEFILIGKLEMIRSRQPFLDMQGSLQCQMMWTNWSDQVRQWLDETFPGRWIGHGSPNMLWPPRWLDLIHCDFFLWDFVKSSVQMNMHNVDCTYISHVLLFLII